MAMERVMSMDNIDSALKTFTSVTTQTDFGPYSAFPPQSGEAGNSEVSTSARTQPGKIMSFSKSLNNMLSFDVKFNWANKSQPPLQEEPQTPSTPPASQEALNRSLISSPNIRRQETTKPEETENIELIQKRYQYIFK